MTHDFGQIANLIADSFGDAGAERITSAAGDRVMFPADGGDSWFVVIAPKGRPRLRDHQWRPFPAKKVPAKRVLVQCIADAPDCWFYVGLDGSYRGLDGIDRKLTPA